MEKVKGGTAGDTITGYAANNDLTGGDGDDTINGGGGDDIIRANDGQGGDIIDCGANTTADPGDTVHIDARFTLNGVQDLDTDSNCETVQRHFPTFSP